MVEEEIEAILRELVKHSAVLMEKIEKGKRGERQYFLGYLHGVEMAIETLKKQANGKPKIVQ